MKKSDYILLISIAVISLFAYFLMRQFLGASNLEDGTAIVLYKDSPILEIYLIDGTYEIIDDDGVVSIDEENYLYIVSGVNGDVVIEYKDNQVRVIDEISPKHICQVQGWSSSPLTPITCLPNNVVIIIEADKSDDDPDDITG
ncbi:MAG: NusG domain II-containing protein [Candidatus Izimaplasma sp.]|nr:NusG domain II-containing protein [Candidatus Izimaplasma bacterium]